MVNKQRFEDGMQLQARDMDGKLRPGILEILSSQVFIQFTDYPDGIFQFHDIFFKEQKTLRLMGLESQP